MRKRVVFYAILISSLILASTIHAVKSEYWYKIDSKEIPFKTDDYGKLGDIIEYFFGVKEFTLVYTVWGSTLGSSKVDVNVKFLDTDYKKFQASGSVEIKYDGSIDVSASIEGSYRFYIFGPGKKLKLLTDKIKEIFGAEVNVKAGVYIEVAGSGGGSLSEGLGGFFELRFGGEFEISENSGLFAADLDGSAGLRFKFAKDSSNNLIIKLFLVGGIDIKLKIGFLFNFDWSYSGGLLIYQHKLTSNGNTISRYEDHSTDPLYLLSKYQNDRGGSKINYDTYSDAPGNNYAWDIGTLYYWGGDSWNRFHYPISGSGYDGDEDRYIAHIQPAYGDVKVVLKPSNGDFDLYVYLYDPSTGYYKYYGSSTNWGTSEDYVIIRYNDLVNANYKVLIVVKCYDAYSGGGTYIVDAYE